jgi:hypothetical protein
MKTKKLIVLLLIAATIHSYSQSFNIQIIKTDDKLIEKKESVAQISFLLYGANETNLVSLKKRALDFKGVKSFEYSKGEQGDYIIVAELDKDFNEISMQKLLLTLNISTVIIDNIEIDSKKISQAFRNDEEYRKELRILNKRIKDIQIKIDWVKQNPEEKALAEENGWFEKANQSIEEAKAQKKALMENTLQTAE